MNISIIKLRKNEGQMKYLQKMSAGFILLGSKEIIGIFSLPNIFFENDFTKAYTNDGFEILNV